MKTRIAVSLVMLAAIIGVSGAALAVPASAQTRMATSYGCRINPKLAKCQKPAKPIAGAPPVTTAPAAPVPATLPTTGGAQPSSPSLDLGLGFAGFALILAGFGVRRRMMHRR